MLQRKFYILLFAVLSVFGKANAANTDEVEVISLIVEFTEEADSKDELFKLAETPVVQFGTDSIYICSTSLSMQFEYSKVKQIYFGDNTVEPEIPDISTSVDEHKSSHFTFEYVDGQTVRMTGVDEAMQVALYSIDGKRMSTDAERNGDEVTIHLAGLQHGFYIIKTNKQSFKIYKK